MTAEHRSNVGQAQGWNGGHGEHWVDHHALTRFETAGGVVLGSASWLVSARISDSGVTCATGGTTRVVVEVRV